MTPMKAIRARCMDCSGFSFKEISECAHEECALHEYRSGHRPKQKATRTPVKAIRAHCIDCCNGDAYEPKKCTAEKCPLFGYRLGKRPIPPQDDFKSECGVLRATFLDSNGYFEGVNVCD